MRRMLNCSNLFFSGLLELVNGARLIPIHFALQVAPQEKVWGAQAGLVGQPEGVKASADEAGVESLFEA